MRRAAAAATAAAIYIVLLAEPEFLLILQRAKSYRGTGTAINTVLL